MKIAVVIKRALLFIALSQAVWFTACEAFRFLAAVPDGGDPASARTIRIHNIAPSIEISNEAKDLIIAESNGKTLVNFGQGPTGETLIKTDGLYLMVVFLISIDSAELESYMVNSKTTPEDVTKNGLAFALMKISGGAATGRILSLSSDVSEIGYYWPGGAKGSEYGIATLLITPDARFILQADFSLGNISIISVDLTTKTYTVDYGSYDGTLPKYEVNFANAFVLNGDLKLVKNPALPSNQGGDMINVFSGYGNPFLPKKMLTDNFVQELVGRFS